jgi:endonuclease/exonuclease/phosphatase family metal-dependent hydrolase
MRLRIATFNVENLAARSSYGPKQRPDTAPALSLFHFAEPDARENVERSVAVALEDDKRELTALAIAETRADILALQEVDNLDVLQAFFSNYVHRVSDLRYEHFKLVHGNDQRGIDVAFVMRKGLVERDALTFRSHRETTFGELDLYSDDLEEFGIRPDDRVFNRDCLEASIAFGDRELTLFVSHFKAMTDYQEERAGTLAVRQAEATAVRRIVERRFGKNWRSANWIVAGDLNDCRERITLGGEVQPTGPSGLDSLLEDFAVNPFARLSANERWTYLYRDLLEPESVLIEEHVQLDYILLSPALAAANPDVRAEVLRRGLPYRVPLDPAAPDRSIAYLATRGDRYPRVGWDRPKASDHCPVVVDIELSGEPGA